MKPGKAGKAKKPARLKARTPRGFRDVEPDEIARVDWMLGAIKKVYHSYGFDPIETPFVEYTESLGKFLPDEDRPNQGVFSFQDDDDEWLSLRYDLTAPLARHVAENFDRLPKPHRSYRSGYVFRNEKPGPGRFRQFMQIDADTVGAASVAADAEICMMAADCMEAVGIKRGDYVIRVNNRKVLDGVMEAIGIGGPEHQRTRITVLRAIDKLDRLGLEGVRQLLGEGRKDESGDFTGGAGLSDEQIASVSVFIEAGERGSLYEHLGAVAGKAETGRQGIAELRDIETLIEAAGYGDGRVVTDPSVVRGLEYYTGPVYEAELTFKVTDEKTGRPIRFGSVGGGGRYDGLVGRFRPESVPATGFSVGVSRLHAALKALEDGEVGTPQGPVVVTVMERNRMADYQKMAAELREAGIRAEVFLGNPKQFGKQLDYADRRGSPCAVIAGSDEFEKNIVQIKDLVIGKVAAAEIEDHQKWKAERPGQFEVPREGFVGAVKGVLGV